MNSDPLTIIHGDALSSLRGLEDESVQCCVTSPPYWGLRDYGIEPIVWDSHNGCEHQWGNILPAHHPGQVPDGKSVHKENAIGQNAGAGTFCECGAWRGSLGLEPTPDLYVSHLVQVFRELKRALHGHGVLWLNLGDSYCGYWGDAKALAKGERSSADTNGWTNGFHMNARPKYETLRATGLKPKDLVGIPWMVAFALRADGWYLRSDIIWSKPNPMPESVKDRPTKAHEYIFLLSKSERYYYDAAAIYEPLVSGESDILRAHATGRGNQDYALASAGASGSPQRGNSGGYPPSYRGSSFNKGKTGAAHLNCGKGERVESAGRNKRSVWNVATQAFPDAHFATFPPELIKPCILAGAPVGGTVIDPFAGSGTTGKVAIELGRKAILIEPKAEYIEMIKKRCQTTIGLPLAI